MAARLAHGGSRGELRGRRAAHGGMMGVIPSLVMPSPDGREDGGREPGTLTGALAPGA